MYEFIVQTYHRLIEVVQMETFRYLFPIFSIKNRLTGVIGPRGVGKTTLLLQFIKLNLYESGKTIYFSADFVLFQSNDTIRIRDEAIST